MSHITPKPIHAFQNRAHQHRSAITTDEDPEDFSNIEFTAGDITKSGLTATPTAKGFNVDLTLTADELNIDTGLYDWELTATFAGEKTRLQFGTLHLDD